MPEFHRGANTSPPANEPSQLQWLLWLERHRQFTERYRGRVQNIVAAGSALRNLGVSPSGNLLEWDGVAPSLEWDDDVASLAPQRVLTPSNERIVGVVASANHVLFLDGDGFVYSSGDAGRGRLGLGDRWDQDAAVTTNRRCQSFCRILGPLESIRVVAISAGSDHSLGEAQACTHSHISPCPSLQELV